MTRSIYETLSAFATDLFFNQVYDMARRDKSDEESLTDAFQRKVPQILATMKTNPDALQTILTRYYEYARKVVPAFETMAVSEMTDRIAEQVIPKEMLKDFTVRQQDEIVEMAIVLLIRDLGSYVLDSRIIELIIDQRDSTALSTTGMIKSRGVQILTKFRDKLYSRLFNEEVGASATVDIEDLERVQERLEKVKRKYHDAKETIGELEEELAGAEDKIEKMAAQQKKLVRLVTILRGKIGQPAAASSPGVHRPRGKPDEETDGETQDSSDDTQDSSDESQDSSSGGDEPDEPDAAGGAGGASDASSEEETTTRVLALPKGRTRRPRAGGKPHKAQKRAPTRRAVPAKKAEAPSGGEADGFSLDELIAQ